MLPQKQNMFYKERQAASQSLSHKIPTHLMSIPKGSIRCIICFKDNKVSIFCEEDDVTNKFSKLHEKFVANLNKAFDNFFVKEIYFDALINFANDSIHLIDIRSNQIPNLNHEFEDFEYVARLNILQDLFKSIKECSINFTVEKIDQEINVDFSTKFLGKSILSSLKYATEIYNDPKPIFNVVIVAKAVHKIKQEFTLRKEKYTHIDQLDPKMIAAIRKNQPNLPILAYVNSHLGDVVETFSEEDVYLGAGKSCDSLCVNYIISDTKKHLSNLPIETIDSQIEVVWNESIKKKVDKIQFIKGALFIEGIFKSKKKLLQVVNIINFDVNKTPYYYIDYLETVDPNLNVSKTLKAVSKWHEELEYLFRSGKCNLLDKEKLDNIKNLLNYTKIHPTGRIDKRKRIAKSKC